MPGLYMGLSAHIPQLNLIDKRKGESPEEVRESYENQTIFNPKESGKKPRRIK
jgi:hypothetical protein